MAKKRELKPFESAPTPWTRRGTKIIDADGHPVLIGIWRNARLHPNVAFSRSLRDTERILNWICRLVNDRKPDKIRRDKIEGLVSELRKILKEM